MQCSKLVSFLLAIVIAGCSASYAQAVQFTYFSGTRIDSTAEASVEFGINSGAQADQDSDVTFSAGLHSINVPVSAETLFSSNGPTSGARGAATWLCNDDAFQFVNEVQASARGIRPGDTAFASSNSSGTAQFTVDTSGNYLVSGFFQFSGGDGDAEASGSVTLSTGLSIIDSLVLPVHGPEPFSQLVYLQRFVPYRLDTALAASATVVGGALSDANAQVQGIIAFVSVPEPSTVCLMALGVLGACGMRRCRHSALLRR